MRGFSSKTIAMTAIIVAFSAYPAFGEWTPLKTVSPALLAAHISTKEGKYFSRFLAASDGMQSGVHITYWMVGYTLLKDEEFRFDPKYDEQQLLVRCFETLSTSDCYASSAIAR